MKNDQRPDLKPTRSGSTIKIFRSYNWIVFLLLVICSTLIIKLNTNKDVLDASKHKESAWLTPEEIKQAEKNFKVERRKKGYKKSDGPNHYMQFHYAIRTREDEQEPSYHLNYRLEELNKAKNQLQLYNKRVAVLDWKERGPANVPGRTRTIVVDPRDLTHKTWIAGAVGGGIWKTTNGGDSWQLLTPDLPSMAFSALAQCQSNPDVLYAGSGEGFFNFDAINGDGVFKSTDGGNSWLQLPSTINNINFQNTNRIIVDPNNPDIVLICANTGSFSSFSSAIMRSTDGGNSWTKVYTGTGRVQQLIHSPTDFNIQYATMYNKGILKSVDAGKTWSSCNVGLQTNGRIEMAISPIDPQTLYAAVEGKLSGQSIDMFVSNNGGQSWALAIEQNNAANINWTGSQGWYNSCITAHPFDKNMVYVGGIDLWKIQLTGLQEVLPLRAETTNTNSFLEFTNFGGLFLNGGITTGEDWFKDNAEFPIDFQKSDYTTVEIRFGAGKKQMAHRFMVPEDKGSGVPPTEYSYYDYVEVPFEVWDVKNNRQLMVSFRDQDRNGVFNLVSNPNNDPLLAREYIFVHADQYNASSVNLNIAKTAGVGYKSLYCMWPVLKSGASWNPNGLPESKVSIITDLVNTKITTNMTDMYNQYEGKNDNVHVDHHFILPIVTDLSTKQFRLLNGNDGGVYLSNTGTDPGVIDGSWKMAGKLYNTSQFYGVDKKKGADEYIGGAQDNGTWRSTAGKSASNTTNYIYQIGGDGFAVVWNYADPLKIIGSSQYNSFWTTIDGGIKWRKATTGLTDIESSKAPFFSKIENNKSNPDVLFTVGSSGVWRSDDFGGTWTSTPITDSWTFGSFTNVKISQANNKIVWAGGAISSSGKLHVSTNGGQSFTKTSGYGSPMGNISGLATHPTEDSTAYALFSFAKSPKILRTKDLGKTWHDITGFTGSQTSTNGFPDVAVYSLFIFPNQPNKIWAGTEIGLVESLDNGLTWSLANNGLPNTAIWEIKLVDNQIVVATHGRGIWTLNVDVQTTAFLAPFMEKAGISPKNELVLDISLRSQYDSLIVIVDNVAYHTERNISGTSKIIKLNAPEPTESLIQIAIDAYQNGLVVRSNYAKTYSYTLLEYGHEYFNDFNKNTSNDFIGNGFEIKLASNFSNMAIHSPHNYEVNQDYIYYLKKPIIISSDNASFSYNDVTIVEPGENNAVFGTDNFYDYAVVEGTKDGLNWVPISIGYDATRNTKWLAAYQNKELGSQAFFVNHNINLLDTFDPGDTILFRFRLYSDPGETGWGWAVDDLLIQTSKILAINHSTEASFSITCYPNPVFDEANIAYSFPHALNASVEIINGSGQIVKKYNIENKKLGKIFWKPVEKGIYFVRVQTPVGTKTQKILVN